jgi:hypothetical protein
VGSGCYLEAGRRFCYAESGVRVWLRRNWGSGGDVLKGLQAILRSLSSK